MSYMTRVLSEARTAYLSRAPGSITFFVLMESVVFISLFCVYCVCYLVCLRPISCVTNVAIVSRFTIFDYPFDFLWCLFCKAHQNKFHHLVFMKCSFIIYRMMLICIILIKLPSMNLSKYIITVIILHSSKRISNILHLILKE